MQYGYFDDENREYIITNPKTPVKWINYIGTLEFGGFVDHTGGSLLCRKDPGLNRITRYLALNPASDFKGETLYIRLRVQDQHILITPFFTPGLAPFDQFRCHIGLGYTRICSRMDGIETQVTIFVPPGANCEVRDIQITNRTTVRLKMDAIPVVEYSHFDALKQLTNADWVPQTMQSSAERMPDGQLFLYQSAFMKRDTAINYLTASLPASSFETDRKYFLGDLEYGSWANPLSLKRSELGCHEALRGDNIGAMLIPLGEIQPGETRRLITLVGQEDNREQIHATAERYLIPEEVDAAFADLADFWQQYLSVIQVETPDAAFNSLINIHNPRQCHTTRCWSRYLSLYQLGYGSRGIGFRDSAQDVMAVFAQAPLDAKKLLCQLLRVQRRDGSAMHQFYPLTMEGSIGDAAEREDRPHYYCDDHLWVVLAVCAYIRESGDWQFLHEMLPFYEKNKDNTPSESVSVLDHLHRGLQFTHDDVGAHGLPLLGFADWNDTINLPAGAESFLAANLYGFALREYAALCQELQLSELSEQAWLWYQEMKERVNQHGWDGQWYQAYRDVDGNPLGSSENSAGKIYAYAQAWPVISGFAEPQQAHKALDAVFDLLNTAQGIKLSSPGFQSFDPHKGGITTYPPGAKENGGIFLHVNPWVIIAETLIGRGERAYQYFSQINPILKNDRIEVFECEPYVYPQNILGDEHPQFGLARNSWLSGTASWMYQAAVQYILGIRPEFSGLKVEPCIPAAWEEYRVTRVFRGATYVIHVKNPNHINRGRAVIEMDGVLLTDNILPVLPAGNTALVNIVLELP